MKLKLSEMDALDPKSGNLPPHKLSPYSFVRMGLELEDQQYVLHYPVRLTELDRPLSLKTADYHAPYIQRPTNRPSEGRNSGTKERSCTTDQVVEDGPDRVHATRFREFGWRP